MHLLVETNFLVELIRGQSQAVFCEKLLQAAEAGDVWLHLPAFSSMEAVHKVVSLATEQLNLDRQVQLQPSEVERETVRIIEASELKRRFTTLSQKRALALEEDLLTLNARMLASTHVIPLSVEVWQRVRPLRESTELTLPDAVIAASLLQRLEELAEHEKFFVTLDRKGFQNEVVRQLFKEKGCDVLFNFEHAWKRLRL